MEDIELTDKTKTKDSIKEERKWCVYIHTNKINNKVYVGITSKQPKKRWGKNGSEYASDQPVMHSAIQKYGWDNFEHIIFADGLTEEEAIHMEILLIALYKSNCKRYNNPEYGYNMTDGGEGVVGCPISEETRRKMSIKAKERLANPENHPMFGVQRFGEDNPFFGKRHTKESIVRMRQAKLGVMSGKNNPMYGKHHSEETRKKMSKNHADFRGEKHPRYGKSEQYTGINSGRAHHVYCIELNQLFVTVSEASKAVGHTGIYKSCKSNGKKSAGVHPVTGVDLHWLYAENAIDQGYITQQDLTNYLKNKKKEIDKLWQEQELVAQ